MTTFPAVRATAALSLLLLLAGCAGTNDGAGGGTEAADTASSQALADGLVLRVDQLGGFVSPDSLLARMPMISVYGDGLVIEPGAQIMIYPSPALPSLQERKISTADVQKLVDRARAAGIGGPKEDYGQPTIADVPTTRFTLTTAAGTDVVEVYGLNEADSGKVGLTAEQINARAALRKLLAALTDLPSTLGAKAAGEQKPYQPAALAAMATRWKADPDVPGQAERTWPGPVLPGRSIGANYGCVDVTGENAQAVLTAAAKANQLTPWVSGGKRWLVALRPTLPDEAGCASLHPLSTPTAR